MDGIRRYKNMQDIIDMELEEYIPLKIIFNKEEEAVEYISYSKDKTSSLEFTVGIKSQNKITKTIPIYFIFFFIYIHSTKKSGWNSNHSAIIPNLCSHNVVNGSYRTKFIKGYG